MPGGGGSGVRRGLTLQVDPRGDEEGDGRVFRGGGWSNGDRRCRVSNRDNNGPDIRNDDLGFRLATSVPR